MRRRLDSVLNAHAPPPPHLPRVEGTTGGPPKTGTGPIRGGAGPYLHARAIPSASVRKKIKTAAIAICMLDSALVVART